jgi:hypothetical protein
MAEHHHGDPLHAEPVQAVVDEMRVRSGVHDHG